MFRRTICLAACIMLLLISGVAAAEPGPAPAPAAFVRSLLDPAGGAKNFAEVELAIDRFVDPTADIAAAQAEVDAVVATLERMLATLAPDAAATSAERMQTLRAFLYRPGWWNGGRPFQYDISDPFGQNPESRLLSHYLATRKGNCVSMPMLFVVLGERLGLDVTLSTAPLHVFVKYRDDATGKTYNLETTSGAGGARDAYYRDKMPMSDAAIENGVYLKTLTRRETIAVMATTVLDHLLDTGRYDEAIEVADAILEAYPTHAYAFVKKGTAYARLLKREFIEKYSTERDIPPALLPRALALHRANLEAFRQAEALGWTASALK